MTGGRMIELAGALVLLGAGLFFYTRRSADGFGSQGAVLLFAVGAIMAIHGLGLLDYRPSAGELEAAEARGQ
jgi:hypothetical protein